MNRKIVIKLLFVATVVLAALSCGEKEEEINTDITSLLTSNANGVIYGEEVSLTASSLGDVFEWTCTGGQIVGTGESVTWKAPNTVGKYTITVSNGKGSTKSRELEVVGSFFWGFDKTSSDWIYDGEHTTRFLTNGKLSVSSSHATESGSYGYKAVDVLPPYSIRTMVAVNREAGSNENHAATFYVYFVPEESSNLRSICFRTTPNAQTWQVGVGRIVGGSTVYYTVEAPQAATLFAANNQYHQIGIAITADKTFIVHADGTELYRTDFLAAETSSLALEKFAYTIQPTLTFMVDDFCFANDGTVLK